MKSAFDLGGISSRVAKLICPAQVRMLYVGRLQMLSFGLFCGHLGIVCILRGGVQSLGI